MPRKARINAPVHCIISSAVRKLGYKCSDVAKTIGISGATVSIAVNLGSKLSEIGKVRKKILETKALAKLLNETNLQNMKI